MRHLDDKTETHSHDSQQRVLHTEHNWGIVDWPRLGRDMKSQFQSVFCVKRVFNSFIACSTVIQIVDLLARHYGMNSSSAAITPSWTKTSLKAIQELVGRWTTILIAHSLFLMQQRKSQRASKTVRRRESEDDATMQLWSDPNEMRHSCRWRFNWISQQQQLCNAWFARIVECFNHFHSRNASTKSCCNFFSIRIMTKTCIRIINFSSARIN